MACPGTHYVLNSRDEQTEVRELTQHILWWLVTEWVFCLRVVWPKACILSPIWLWIIAINIWIQKVASWTCMAIETLKNWCFSSSHQKSSNRQLLIQQTWVSSITSQITTRHKSDSSYQEPRNSGIEQENTINRCQQWDDTDVGLPGKNFKAVIKRRSNYEHTWKPKWKKKITKKISAKNQMEITLIKWE